MGQSACSCCVERHQGERNVNYHRRPSRTQIGLHDSVAKAREVNPIVAARVHRPPEKYQDDYEVDPKKALGEGKSGCVLLGKGKLSGCKVAVKNLGTVNLSDDDKEEILSELQIFLTVDHPHVTRLLDVYMAPTELTLVMECMAGGELLSRVLKAKPAFEEPLAASTSWQMLLAVHYLHCTGIVHRDLKLENFLYEGADSEHLKLADFGMSRCHGGKLMTEIVGTLMYLAPEVLQDDYDELCDMWSFGVCVFVVLFGYLPFSDPEDIHGPEIDSSIIRRKYKTEDEYRDRTMQRIVHGRWNENQERWEGVSDLAKDFVRKVLVDDPKKRLSAGDALSHDWVQAASIEERRRILDEDSEKAVIEALITFAKAPALEKACLSVMSLGLNQDQEKKVRVAFLALDEDCTGAVGFDELKALLKQHGIDEEEASRVFKALDTTGDGMLGYSEFLSAMLSTNRFLDACSEQLLKKAFMCFDKDHSGSVSPEEVRAIMGPGFEEGVELLSGADKDGDGQISFQEFEAYVAKCLKGGGDAQ